MKVFACGFTALALALPAVAQDRVTALRGARLLPVGTDPGAQALRVFPVWPRERDARFEGLRTWGAFLVSSELAGGRVRFVRIESERGRPCTVVNPWPGGQVLVQRSDGSEDLVRGDRFTLATKTGDPLILRPR